MTEKHKPSSKTTNNKNSKNIKTHSSINNHSKNPPVTSHINNTVINQPNHLNYPN